MHVLVVLEKHGGNAKSAAEALGVSYYTLWRLIRGDKALGRSVKQLRQRMSDSGIVQRGWERNQ